MLPVLEELLLKHAPELPKRDQVSYSSIPQTEADKRRDPCTREIEFCSLDTHIARVSKQRAFSTTTF
eukprot:5403968-Pleurochrysis_carterae.AAC.1